MRFLNTIPAVPKHWLFGLAGILWCGAGVLLCWRGFGWLSHLDLLPHALFGSSGIVLAVIMYNGGFHKVVHKNIRRICSLPARASLFAVASIQGYIIIGAMITMGMFLRSSDIPKQYLSVPYLAMGGSLLLGSFKLFEQLWRVTVRKEPCISRAGQTNSTP